MSSHCPTYSRVKAHSSRFYRHPIVYQIVDRQHVGASYSRVLREFADCMRSGLATYRALPRNDRRAIVATIIDRHNANRNTYRAVMFGR